MRSSEAVFVARRRRRRDNRIGIRVGMDSDIGVGISIGNSNSGEFAWALRHIGLRHCRFASSVREVRGDPLDATGWIGVAIVELLD